MGSKRARREPERFEAGSSFAEDRQAGRQAVTSAIKAAKKTHTPYDVTSVPHCHPQLDGSVVLEIGMVHAYPRPSIDSMIFHFSKGEGEGERSRLTTLVQEMTSLCTEAVRRRLEAPPRQPAGRVLPV